MTAVVAPGDPWQPYAACSGQDIQVFFASSPARARAICRPCPVRAECLHDALVTKAPEGIWGGLTVGERAKLPDLPATPAVAVAALRDFLTAYDLARTDPDPDTTPQPDASATAGRSGQGRRPTAVRPAATRKERLTADEQAAARAERRAQIAAMLRQGATHKQIIDRLGTSSTTVSSVRREYNIPAPAGAPGYRYTPEQRAAIEERTVDLLCAGATYQEIRDEMGISPSAVLRIRRAFHLPAPAPGRRALPPRTVDEALAATVEAYGDGHARWTGPMAGRMPQLCAGRGKFNARHVIFGRHHDRPPVGYVRPDCGESACIAGAHLTDDLMRATTGRATAPDVRTSPPMPAHTPAADSTTAPAPSGPSGDPTAEELLAWGDAHTEARTRQQAAAARAALAYLLGRHNAGRELARLDKTEERLNRQLAQLRARRQELAPAPPRKHRDPDAAAARAWAQETGTACPPTGRVPKAVMDAWRTATADSTAETLARMPHAADGSGS